MCESLKSEVDAVVPNYWVDDDDSSEHLPAGTLPKHKINKPYNYRSHKNDPISMTNFESVTPGSRLRHIVIVTKTPNMDSDLFKTPNIFKVGHLTAENEPFKVELLDHLFFSRLRVSRLT